MNNKKISIGLVSLLLVITLIPQITFASWWNPFSWFNKQPNPVQIETPISNNSAIDTKTSDTEKIQQLQKQLDDLKKQQPASITTTPIVKKAKKTVPVIDNSAVIKAQVDAALKVKADQDALIAKQKFDEQAKADAIKAEADKEAQIDALNAQNQAIQRANEAAKEAQAQIDAQNQAQQQALQAKQEKLNAINQQIATLNAKYASDVAKARTSGVTTEQSDAIVRYLNSQYTIDYDALQAQWQQIKYSN